MDEQREAQRKSSSYNCDANDLASFIDLARVASITLIRRRWQSASVSNDLTVHPQVLLDRRHGGWPETIS